MSENLPTDVTRRRMRWAWFLLPGVLLVPGIRHAIEARMILHMLVEFPVIGAAGFAASRLWAPPRGASPIVEAVACLGLVPLLYASLYAMFWMVPLALDMTLLDGRVNAVKYITLFVAGVAVSEGLVRAPTAILLFFVGNLVWTLATVGMLFTQTETRLCANYLLPDQQLTGVGLVIYAIAISAALTLYLRRLPGFGFSPQSETRLTADPRHGSDANMKADGLGSGS